MLGFGASSASAHFVTRWEAAGVFMQEVNKRCGGSTWVCMERTTRDKVRDNMRRVGSHSIEVPTYIWIYEEWLPGLGYIDAGNNRCWGKGRVYHLESPAAYFDENCS
jgi:hypothetical protein